MGGLPYCERARSRYPFVCRQFLLSAIGGKTMKLAWVLAAGAMLAAAPSWAQSVNFFSCDGYPAPNKKSDGITRADVLWGLGSRTSDFRRNQAQVGGTGAAWCDAAIASPLLLESFWLRRSHLLQAKALHLLADGKPAEALAVLDQSDALGTARADPDFQVSIAVGNQALRVVALHGLGRTEEARKLLATVDSARPYSVSFQVLRRQLASLFDDEPATANAQMRLDGVLEPRLFLGLFWNAMLEADFSAALARAPDIAFAAPAERGGWSSPELPARYKLIEDRAEFNGAVAYALAATGRGDAAKARLAEARATLDVVRIAPPTDSKGRMSRTAQTDYSQRLAAAKRAEASLDQWESNITLRAAVSGKTLAEATALVEKMPKGSVMMIVDILRQVKPVDAVDRAQIESILVSQERRVRAERAKQKKFELEELVSFLPRPETMAMRPRVARVGLTIFVGDGMKGFTAKPIDGTDLVDVSFGSNTSSSAQVEEAAFLAAANYARKQGKDGIAVVASQLIRRTLNITTTGWLYGSSTSSAPAGYEMRLVVRPVDRSALPSDLKDAGWRIVGVDDVLGALAPRYTPAGR